jgi:hypothetical protein
MSEVYSINPADDRLTGEILDFVKAKNSSRSPAPERRRWRHVLPVPRQRHANGAGASNRHWQTT